jgi:hypothetical protein
VKDLKNSVVIPKLRQYLADCKLKNPGKDPKSVRHLIEFKYGYESFSLDMFNNIKISCEQGIFILLPKGVKYPNHFLQPVHSVSLEYTSRPSFGTVSEPV